MERPATPSNLVSKKLPQLLIQQQDQLPSTKMQMKQFRVLQELISSQRASSLKVVNPRTKAKTKSKKMERVFTKTRQPMAMELVTSLLEGMALLLPRAMKVAPMAEWPMSLTFQRIRKLNGSATTTYWQMTTARWCSSMKSLLFTCTVWATG